MSKVVVMDHPLIQHKIGIMRRTDTGSKDFRTLVSEVAMLECYEATRDLKLTDVEIDTPICHATVKELKGKKLAVVPAVHRVSCAAHGVLEIHDACAFKFYHNVFSPWLKSGEKAVRCFRAPSTPPDAFPL